MLCTLPWTNPVRSSCPIISVPWGIQIFDQAAASVSFPLLLAPSLWHKSIKTPGAGCRMAFQTCKGFGMLWHS